MSDPAAALVTMRSAAAGLLSAYDAYVKADGAPAGDAGAALDARASSLRTAYAATDPAAPPADGTPVVDAATANARDDLIGALHDELRAQAVPIAVVTAAVDRTLRVVDFAAVTTALAAADTAALAGVNGASPADVKTAQAAWMSARAQVGGPAGSVLGPQPAVE